MSDTQSVDRFRGELQTFLHDNLRQQFIDVCRQEPTASSITLWKEWNLVLADHRWAAPAWPSEHGGRGASIAEQLAYAEEMSHAGAPGPVNTIGVSNIAPAIMSFGTPQQQQRFLPSILTGEEIWSQGMSEPDAGSDLAGIRTSAALDGDTFVINGQKTWNSLGHLADWCQLYVRTDATASRHRGLSCLLIDLRTPGIDIRPLRTITGDETFGEIFFTDARVPVSALLGDLHDGWTVAVTTLAHERAGVAKIQLELTRKLERLIREVPDLEQNLVARQDVARLHSDIACMGWYARRSLADSPSDTPSPALGGLSKLAWARIEKDLASVAVAHLGFASLSGEWGTNVSWACQSGIAGGTTEINRNIIAERVLGLPRDRAAG